MKKKVFRLGTRKSELALTQSRSVAAELLALGVECELVLVESEGDQDRTTPLYQIENESPGLFTKNLEKALLDKRIDLAVHSFKDLPTQQPPSLRVAAVLKRASAHDCLLVNPAAVDSNRTLKLKAHARIGTSSLRREALMLWLRPDVVIESIRGNVPTRVKAVRDGKFDAVVFAEAGLDRLNPDLGGTVRMSLDETEFVSAPAQGALAVEVRDPCDAALTKALEKLHDLDTFHATTIERRILRELEGGCTLPLGVYCRVEKGVFHVRSFLGTEAERGGNPRKWVSFQRFDISGVDIETLVANTVAHFRESR